MVTGKPLAPRPLSPHLQIYRLQLTSFLSVTHRLSEVVLFVGALFWALALMFDYIPPYWLFFFPGKLLLWMGVMVLTYHFLGLVRHLILDLGYGFDLRVIYGVGWISLLAWGVFGIFLLRYSFDGL